MFAFCDFCIWRNRVEWSRVKLVKLDVGMLYKRRVNGVYFRWKRVLVVVIKSFVWYFDFLFRYRMIGWSCIRLGK